MHKAYRSMAATDACRASAVVVVDAAAPFPPPPPLPPAIDVDVLSAAVAASRLGRRVAAADCDKRECWW